MELIKKLAAGAHLSDEEAAQAMEGMISGSFTSAQSAAILVALKMKGETVSELASFARVMRKHAVKISPGNFQTSSGSSKEMKISPKNDGLVDTCGTGGDSLHTFNISTAAALIACGAGASVAKHGNRSVSSASGSADVLEALGVRILEPRQAETCIGKVGFGFLFAPYFHPAMKNVMPVRKELGIRTVFNMLGPLTNPAGAQSQLLGVFDLPSAEKMARALALLGTRHALVVHSEGTLPSEARRGAADAVGGMDEIGLGISSVFEVKGREVSSYSLDAAKFGFQKREIPRAHSAADSAKMIRGVLANKQGAARDVAVLNAAAAIYVSGKAGSLEEGLLRADESVASGKAMEKLEGIREFSG